MVEGRLDREESAGRGTVSVGVVEPRISRCV